MECSLCYDAVAILGLGKASDEPLPETVPGEVVIRVGAWSLKDLRTCEAIVRANLMWDDTWCDKYEWSGIKLTPGVYRVRLPIPDSNSKNFNEQKKLLRDGESVAPAALVAVAILCHLTQAGKDLLENDWTRCAELLPDGYRVALGVRGGRVYVYDYWDGGRSGRVWLAGSRVLNLEVVCDLALVDA